MRKLVVACAVVLVGSFLGGRLSAEEHAAVGAEKCAKVCHKVQLKSWEESKHAAADPKTECETCHGNGADYMKMKIMKDPEAAKAAGLIMPDKASCTAKCHEGQTFTDEQVATVHAHKEKK